MRELSIDERFTIRTIAPKSFQHLKKFVETYSMCPCVYEIQVLCEDIAYDLPSPESFAYAHTHSKVSVHKVSSHSVDIAPFISSLSIGTEGKCQCYHDHPT